MNFEIEVRYEAPWFIAEVVNRGVEPYYAQGETYEEALANLFSVIQMVKEERNCERSIPETLPWEKSNFSIPAFA